MPTRIECFKNFSAHLRTQVSSCLSRVLRRNVSTQLVKHLSTSVLYILKLLVKITRNKNSYHHIIKHRIIHWNHISLTSLQLQTVKENLKFDTLLHGLWRKFLGTRSLNCGDNFRWNFQAIDTPSWNPSHHQVLHGKHAKSTRTSPHIDNLLSQALHMETFLIYEAVRYTPPSIWCGYGIILTYSPI